MQLSQLKKKCKEWKHKSWKNGSLIDYWDRGGLTIGQIVGNKEKLLRKTYPIAILGSVGKTTLSRILYGLIKQNRLSCYVTKINDNWLPQLPFAVQIALVGEAEISIFECGVACKNDSILMSSVVPAQTVVYTEFTEANLSELDSLLGVAKEKLMFALENPEARIISHVANRYYLENEGIKGVIYYGKVGSNADFTYEIVNMTEASTEIKILNHNKTIIRINDIGFHLGPACCGAVAMYLSLRNTPKLDNVPFLEIKSYSNPKQRMQRYGHDGVKLIIDVANSNEASILNSLETTIRMSTNSPKNAIIGEIYGLGDKKKRIMLNLINHICEMNMNVFNTIHFIGRELLDRKNRINKNIRTRIYFYNDETEFKAKFNIKKYKGQILLLRGPTSQGINISNILESYDGNSEETSPEEVKKI